MTIIKSIPGSKIAVKYDPQANPFFEVMVKDAIKNTAMFQVGRNLLHAIQVANPGFTGEAGVFPTGVNVLIVPSDEKMTLYSNTFHKPTDTENVGINVNNDAFNYEKDRFFQNQPNATYFRTGAKLIHSSQGMVEGGNGKGTVAKVYFSNSRRQLTSGSDNPPFIGLAHELIHALHGLNGEKKGRTDEEENRTVGVDKYARENICENALRAAAKLPRRNQY